MRPRARERPSGPPTPGIPPSELHFGRPADDALTARLFPALPGSVKWGLERTERLLAALGDPHRSYPVLHVGGTNGKGSVARIWASILRAAGFRTGLYTSPHLVSFRERILVEGRPLPDEALEEWSRDLRPLLLRESPSFFEAATVLAFHAFARTGVEVAVVEVGLGGRLDATNVVSPVLTAITNVSLDHSDLLGQDIASIAREKAGILKPGVPAFTAADDSAVLSVLGEEAAVRGAILRRVGEPQGRIMLEGSRFRLQTARWGLLELASSLSGRHQLRNLALAVSSLEALPPRLPVSAGAIREGVLRARVPGRFQVQREGGRLWILDVAHNTSGAEALAQTLHEMALPRPRVGVLGILEDKPWREMIGHLAPHLDVVILTVAESAPEGRRWDPVRAAEMLASDRFHPIPDLGEALELAQKEAGGTGTVLVAGSLFTVGDVLIRRGWVPMEALPPAFAPG